MVAKEPMIFITPLRAADNLSVIKSPTNQSPCTVNDTYDGISTSYENNDQEHGTENSGHPPPNEGEKSNELSKHILTSVSICNSFQDGTYYEDKEKECDYRFQFIVALVDISYSISENTKCCCNIDQHN